MQTSSTQEPISPEEFLLRRVHVAHYDESRPLPVQRVAFKPTKADTTGLSFFRERDHADPTSILADILPEKQQNYHIVRVSVAALNHLGLSVVPEDDPTTPGHVVVPS